MVSLASRILDSIAADQPWAPAPVDRSYSREGMLSDMDHRMTALERAFQLARSGQVSGLPQIVEGLRGEGYSVNQVQGPILRRQLADLIIAARERDLIVHRI